MPILQPKQMRRDQRKMGTDQAQANMQGGMVRSPVASSQPTAPRVPATRGAKPTIPTFQASKQAPMPPPVIQPRMQQAPMPPAPPPQGMAPAAPPGGPAGPGGAVAPPGSQDQYQNWGGGAGNRPSTNTAVDPYATKASPSTLDFYLNDPQETADGHSIDTGGMTTDSEADLVDASVEAPIENDPRDMFNDYLAGLDADTAAEEALIREIMEGQTGQSVVDARAGLRAGGFGTGGAAGALEGDLRRRGAMDTSQMIDELRDREDQQKLDAIMGGIEVEQGDTELGQGQQELDITKDAYDSIAEYLESLNEDGGGGGGGGGAAGDAFENIQEGFEEGGVGGALTAGQQEALDTYMDTVHGQAPSSWKNVDHIPTGADIVESKPSQSGQGYIVTWTQGGETWTSFVTEDPAGYNGGTYVDTEE